jgi:hypothetical protein
MCSVRSVEVVEPFPDSRLLLQTNIALVGEELIELVLVGSMGPLDLAIELRRTRLDVDVFHSLISDMPME